MKKLIFIFMLLLGWLGGSGQNYVRLADQSGYEFPSTANTDLEQLATQIIDALPQEYRSQFKVYDFGYYVINEFMVGQNDEPAIWQSVTRDADNRSPYYLLFGREFNHNGAFNTLRVELKLPTSGTFTCIDASYLTIIKNAVTLPASSIVFQLGNTMGFGPASVIAEKGAMTVLKNHLTKISTCCINGIWSPSCGNCRYSGFEAESFFLSKGFMKLGASNIAITDQTYGGITSNKKITFDAQGEFVNFTDDLNALAVETGSTIRLTEITGSNCDNLNSFQTLSGSGSFIEDIVLINIDGYVTVMSKIQINKAARFVPVWVVVEVMKRLGTATIAAAVEVGVNVLLEWWIGGHGSFMDAWDASDIDWVEVMGAFAEGAVSEAKYASFVITALKPVVKWIINTPYSAYFDDGKGQDSRGPGWIAALGTQIVNAFASTALEEFVLKKVDIITKVATKYLGSVNSHIKGKLPKMLINIAAQNPKLIKKYKDLIKIFPTFNGNSDLLEDPNFLDNVIIASKIPKNKIIGQKLGYAANGTTLKGNIKHYRGSNGSGAFSHHIVPGGKNNAKLTLLRNKMKGMGIDINEGINGVDVPQNVHSYTFTNEYDADLYNRLKDKLTPESFRAELDEIFKLLAAHKRLDGSIIP